MWRGENLDGKTLLLVHDLGFGDTIMMLRYVPLMQERCPVLISVPPELMRLAGTLAPVPTWRAKFDVDYWLPINSMMLRLGLGGTNIPRDPYLSAPADLVAAWRERLPSVLRLRIGIAWDVGLIHDGDYPRSIPLEILVQRLRQVFPGAELHSLQQQDTIRAASLGVIAHTFEDFADCAALISRMDRVYSIDTAALHLAGAIGHPHVTALLSHWHSWRWTMPWYPDMHFATQRATGDWDSALAQIS